jgi:EmrB/QacA subfamily drug resistance transporter
MHLYNTDGPHVVEFTPTRRWWVLAALSLAQFMVILDATVVNVALPMMASQLGLARVAMTWVVTAYTLCFGGLMLLGGRLADTFGRKRLFLAGLTVFTLASLGSALATGSEMIISSRAAQGMGAAMLSPAALSLVMTTFRGRERNTALGVWAALGGAGAAVGVMLGGLLASGPGWQWAFYINVPVGIVAAVAIVALRPNEPPPVRRRVDWVGAALATGGLALLIFTFVNAGDIGWGSARTVLGLAAGGVILAGFLFIERQQTSPLVRPEFLGSRYMLTGNALMLTGSALLVAVFFLGSQYLQRVLEVTPATAGLVFLPLAVSIGLGTHVGLNLVQWIGPRLPAVGGFLMAAGGCALLVLLPASGSPWGQVLPGLLVAGFGVGAVLVAATTTALACVDPAESGTASALMNTQHELGSSIGVALFSSLAVASLVGPRGAVADMGGYALAFEAAAAIAIAAATLGAFIVPSGRPPASSIPISPH